MEEKTGKRIEAEELNQLKEENRKLREENERLRKLPLKERLYDHVHVSLKTMDRIIFGLCVLFVIVVVAGMLKG